MMFVFAFGGDFKKRIRRWTIHINFRMFKVKCYLLIWLY